MFESESGEHMAIPITNDYGTVGVIERNPRLSSLAVGTLDALPFGVAVLDHAGRITAANATWRRMVHLHSGGPKGGVGEDYLDVSRRATGLHDADAEAVSAGIHGVRERRLPEFNLEFPSRAPGRNEWYLLRAAPLETTPFGVVVAHINISERKRTEERHVRALAREQAAREAADAARQRAEQIHAVTDAAVNHLALAELVPDLSDRVLQRMGVDLVSVLVLEKDQQTLKVAGACDVHDLVPLQEGVAGRIAISRQPVTVDDLSPADRNLLPKWGPIRSLAGVPLVAANRLVGVLLVGTALRRHFGGDDVSLLMNIANRIAPALDRACEFEDARISRHEAEERAKMRSTQSSRPCRMASWCVIPSGG